MRVLRLRFPFLLVTVFVSGAAGAQSTPVPSPSPPAQALAQNRGAVTISLDDAIQMALQHNHNILAARTTIQQNEAEETTANLRPNPVILSDWQFLPVFQPSQFSADYLDNIAQFDLGVSYLFERGKKRQHRLRAAKDLTAQTRSLVADNERGLAFSVASQFINVELAESTLELARQDLKSFQNTVDISDLRQLLGYESIVPDYDVAGAFDYQPVKGNLDDFQAKALQNRPDLRAAQQGVTAANSQHALQQAIGKRDITGEINYTHIGYLNDVSLFGQMQMPVFDRNQGEIARAGFAITQAQEQERFANGQVLTDVRDAFENLRTNDQIVGLYRSGYINEAQQSRDISEYAYRHGAASLLDFLDSERSYRATQLAYRQALASYLLALEQLREAVGTRSLP
jgi:cobalt-zinc-cadmium efflux system outer membrane protein